MALTITYPRDAYHNPGDEKATVVDVAFDSNYLTNGMPLTARQLGLRAVRTVDIYPPNASNLFTYDIAGARLKAYIPAGTEVTGGTNLSTVTGVRLRAMGY